ncbi:MAG: type IV pili twitching motility protein PilT, partial [Thermoleophilaceae bacterium]
MFDLNTALRRVIETDGSDLHLKVPSRPLIRRLGQLEPIPDTDPLTPEDTERVLRELLADENKLAEFEADNEVDFSFSVPGLSRFRVNAFRQRGVISLVCRAVPHEIKTIETLGLPEVISEI